MNKGLVAGIVGVLVIAGIGGAWWAYTRGFEEGRAKGREEGSLSPKQVTIDTGTVYRILNNKGIHFGAPHVSHDLLDDGLSAQAFKMLDPTHGRGLAELHDDSLGGLNACIEKRPLSSLSSGTKDGRINAVNEITTLDPPDTSGSHPYQLSIKAPNQSPMVLDFSIKSDRDAEHDRIKEILGAVTTAGGLLDPDPAQLDFVLTREKSQKRVGLIHLTLLQAGVSVDCGKHACSGEPDDASASSPSAP